MANVVEAVDLHRIYESASGYTHALRGVSLTVAQGEFLAIMGPSGSGKSTLMNLLGCLDTPTRGRYLLEGVDVADYRDDELAEIRATRLGFVFQSFNLLPRATVLRNVVLPLIYTACPRKERELRAHAALRSVSLDERLYDHRSNELSGGQMQRCLLYKSIGIGDLVWTISDITNALMAIPNIIVVLLLSGLIARETKHYVWDKNLDETDDTPIPVLESK